MKKKRIVAVVLVIAVFAAMLAGCGKRKTVDESESYADFEWPTTGLAAMIPKPDSMFGLFSQSSDSLSATCANTSQEDFKAYVKDCESCGFTVDSYEDSDEYCAYYSEDDKIFLKVTYSSDDERMYISMAVYENLPWPLSSVAEMLPEPPSLIGKVSYNSSTRLSLDIRHITKDLFYDYVSACQDYGFTEDYSGGIGSTSYRAYDADGCEVSLYYYESGNYMSVSLDVSDEHGTSGESVDASETEDTEEIETETEESETEETKAESETEEYQAESSSATQAEPASEEKSEDTSSSTSSSTGIRSEIKDALDSYESFMNDYVEFMKKYESSSDTIGMLSDYMSYLSEYADMMDKFEAIDENDLNDAELAYYLEVTSRVTKKLSELY